MTIIREKSHSRNFVILHKAVLKDPNLSLKAKGLWAYLMSLPDDWHINTQELTKHSIDGRDSVRNALKELVKQGYAEKLQTKGDKGQFNKGGWKIFEVKKTLPKTENPSADNPSSENLSSEKTSLLSNKRLSNEELSNKRKSVASPSAQRLASYLFSSILKINPKAKPPNLDSWQSDIERMLRLDNRSEAEIEEVINWVFTNKFWCKNILSARKLREKFDQLVMAIKSDNMPPPQANKKGKLRSWETKRESDEWQPSYLNKDDS